MKFSLLFVAFLLSFARLLQAQDQELQVQGVSPALYLLHTVQPKENWYSVGRLYNVSPKTLAPYNHLALTRPLAIGEQVKVPLTAENFSQDGKLATGESLVPVYHTIQSKEWLYRISQNYNKVPVDNLEKWNSINKDQARAGLPLIIGYLKVKPAESALARLGRDRIASGMPVPLIIPEDPKMATDMEKKPVQPAVPATVPAHIDPAAARSTATPAADPAKPSAVHTETTSGGNAAKPNYFRAQFEDAGKSLSGSAGTFKSTSGWNDGKFYALVNNVPVGTIVKINNPVSGKAVFAKVLGSLPDMKESLGLVARVSDAAAAQLDAAGTRFSVEVRY
jgi:LysM repeat protein